MKFTLTLLTLMFLAVPARGADVPCASDTDCGKGQICIPSPCSTPACPPETDCPKVPDCSNQSFCGAAAWDGSCTADSDCPTGFTCDSVEVPCAISACTPCTCACPAEGECPACECPVCDAQQSCTPTTSKTCQYHPATCTTDGDCKDGWACKAEEICVGTGCACSACAPDTECPPCDCPDITEPTCQTSGSWCQPKESTCTADADCAAGFECIERSTGGICACPMCACPADSTDCQCGTCDCPPATTEHVCLPKGWAAIGFSGGSSQWDSGTPVVDGDATSTTKGTDATTPPSTPGTGTQTGANENVAATPSGGGNACHASPGAGAPIEMSLLLFVALLPLLRRRFPNRA